ncbi:MAG: hypothetical protein WBJ10_09795 [Daejeonella sp.]|uniref:hypothetical protein n=1 Tax=Daejeonella sp. TaxID=2805397 RepID=UPI003C7204D7
MQSSVTRLGLSFPDCLVIDYHNILKHFSLSDEKSFGLDLSFVTVERVPIVVDVPSEIELKRISPKINTDY